jgi:hypothetical protein
MQLMLSRYAAIRGVEVAQTAACNQLHDIGQRLPRWLLMPSVSEADGVLQKWKLIEYARGAVKIVNRKKLENSACECDGVIQQFDSELGVK